MAIKNVIVVGANGNVGSEVLKALASNSSFTVSVLRRASSRSTPVLPVHVIEAPDNWATDAVTQAMAGADAVVCCFPVSNVDEHMRIADAAAAAGVQRFIPADFGSCDARSARARELVPLFERKVKIREHLETLAARSKDGSFSWTSIVCGHFFDWGLREGFLHFDLSTRKAEILDDGRARSSTSTLARVAEAVVSVLQRPAETRNRVLMMQSFCVSQLDVLRSLERATGQTWAVEHIESTAFINSNKAKADAGDKQAVEDLVFALGVVDGDWETKPDFAMDLLDLKNEDLDEVVQRVISTADGDKQPSH